MPPSEAVAPGTVFVSYAREDRERLRPVVQHLHQQGFDIWWDESIEPGTSFRTSIQNSLDEAACVLVFWSSASVDSDFVRSEASSGSDRGVVLPVLLDAGARIPVGFTELQHVDLSAWTGDPAALPPVLIDRTHALVRRGRSQPRWASTLKDGNDWPVGRSQAAVAELRDLTSQVRSISEVLLGNSSAVRDLRGALGEVGKTYDVVNSAILRFVAPAFETGAIDARPFVEMERGSLAADIEDGRGRCTLILTHYGRYGGLRDWIKDKLPPAELARLDAVFGRLGTADGDLFRSLADIGEVLTNESRVIANLLAAGQTDLARQRIRDGRVKLAPLEDQLATAIRELKQLASSLGYAG